MIKITKAILHIMDFNSNVTVFSDQELNIQNDNIMNFLKKHIEKSLNDPALKPGIFRENSHFKKELEEYIKNDLTFVEFSVFIAKEIHSAISKSDKLDSLDLIICDVIIDNERLIGILECVNNVGFTHQVVKRDNEVKNEIINHYAILPTISQKLNEYAFINTDSLSIKFLDKKRYIEGQDTYIIPDILLECSSAISPKEAIKIVNSITSTVADNYGQNSFLAVSKAKNYIIENMEVSDILKPKELGKEVFNSTAMQEDFIKKVEDAGIPDKVKLEKTFAVRTGKNHKIKTDTGIEITFPVDYFENKDFIEFINNPDGTLSIQLKNIGKVINK